MVKSCRNALPGTPFDGKVNNRASVKTEDSRLSKLITITYSGALITLLETVPQKSSSI